MTPQEETVHVTQQLNQAMREHLELVKAQNDSLPGVTDSTGDLSKSLGKAGMGQSKVAETAMLAAKELEKMYQVSVQYRLAMAKGEKGSAKYNAHVDQMADTTQKVIVGLSTFAATLIGGPVLGAVVGGLTMLATNALKTAAALQKSANEQGDALSKSFQDMSEAGATASDGMGGLFKDVQRMRLNVYDLGSYTAMMAESAKELTAMGGTSREGAKQLADLTENLSDFETGMRGLGKNNEKQAEAIMGFMKNQSNISRGQQKDYGRQSAAARKYIEETEVLARVTGLNRKQQEDIQERQMSQQRSGAVLRELALAGETDKIRLIQNQVKIYHKMGPEAEQGYNDILSGQINTQAAQKLNAITQGKAMQDQQDILEGRVKTDQEAAAATEETAKVMGQVQDDMLGLAKSGGFEDVFGPFKEASEGGKIAANNLAESVAKAAIEVNKLTGTVAGIDEETKRRIEFETGQRKDMTKEQAALANQWMSDGFTMANYLKLLTGAFGEFGKAIEPLIIMAGKLIDVFTPLVSGLGDMLVGAVSLVVKFMTGDIIGGLTDFKKGWDSAAKGLKETAGKWWSVFTDTWSTFGKNLLKSVEFVTGPLGPVFEKMGTMATDVWDSIKKSADDFGAGLLKGIALITSPLTDAFGKVKDGVLGLTDNLKESMGKFGNILVDMVNDIWKKLVNLIPGLIKAKEFAGAAVDTTKRYAQTGADTVKNAGDTAVDFVSSIFGGVGAPAPPAPAPAAASGKPPAPASAASAAPASAAPSSGGFFSSIGDLFGGGEKVATTTPSAPPGTPAASGNKPSTAGSPASAPAAPAAAPAAPAAAPPAPTGGKPAAPAPAPAAPSGGGGKPAPAPAAPSGGGGGKEPSKSTPPPDAGGNKGAGGDVNMDDVRKRIIAHEGLVQYPYKDTKGLWTIGVGHLIGDGKKLPSEFDAYKDNGPAIGAGSKNNNTTPAWSMERVMAQLDNDISGSKAGAERKTKNYADMASIGKAAFIDLAFNMGPDWIVQKKFVNLDAALVKKDNAGIMKELIHSDWYNQVGARGKEVVGMAGQAFARDGGVFDGPKSGYAATLHGNEAVIPLKDGAVPVSMSQEFNMTAVNLGELVNQMKYNMAVQDRMVTVLEEIRRAQTTTADNTGRMVAYASN